MFDKLVLKSYLSKTLYGRDRPDAMLPSTFLRSAGFPTGKYSGSIIGSVTVKLS